MPISFSVVGGGGGGELKDGTTNYKWIKDDGLFTVVVTREEIESLRRLAQRYRVYLLPKDRAAECKNYNDTYKASLIRFTTDPSKVFDLFDEIIYSLRNMSKLIHIQAQLRENQQVGGLSEILNRISNNELMPNPPKLHSLKLESSDNAFREIFRRFHTNEDSGDVRPFKVHVERYGSTRNLRDTKEKRIIWIVTEKSQLLRARQEMLDNTSPYEAYVLWGQDVEKNKEMVVCLQEGIDALNRVDWNHTYRSPSSSSSTPPVSVLVAEFQKAVEAIKLTDGKQLNSILI